MRDEKRRWDGVSRWWETWRTEDDTEDSRRERAFGALKNTAGRRAPSISQSWVKDRKPAVGRLAVKQATRPTITCTCNDTTSHVAIQQPSSPPIGKVVQHLHRQLCAANSSESICCPMLKLYRLSCQRSNSSTTTRLLYCGPSA